MHQESEGIGENFYSSLVELKVKKHSVRKSWLFYTTKSTISNKEITIVNIYAPIKHQI